MVSTKIFVGNLCFRTKAQELAGEFSAIGKVVDVNIITRGPRSLGYGFVDMEIEEDAQKAVDTMNKKVVDGREINVELAKPRAELPPRSPRRERGARLSENNAPLDPSQEKGESSQSGEGQRRPRFRRRRPRGGAGPRGGGRGGARFPDRVVSDQSAENSAPSDQQQPGSEPPEITTSIPSTKTEERPERPLNSERHTRVGRGGRRGGRGRGRGGYYQQQQPQAFNEDGTPVEEQAPNLKRMGTNPVEVQSGEPEKRRPFRPRQRRSNPSRLQSGTASKTGLFVANLPFSVDKDELLEIFMDFKPLSSNVIMNRNARSKGFGFVELPDEEQQQAALSMDKKVVKERSLVVKVAIILPPRPPRPESKATDVESHPSESTTSTTTTSTTTTTSPSTPAPAPAPTPVNETSTTTTPTTTVRKEEQSAKTDSHTSTPAPAEKKNPANKESEPEDK